MPTSEDMKYGQYYPIFSSIECDGLIFIVTFAI